MTPIESMIIRHEGIRLKPYKDSVGLTTIGVGRCLDRKGITQEEAYYLLRNDIAECIEQLEDTFPWFIRLDDIRQDALTDMCFNLGIEGLKKFQNMLKAIEDKDWQTAHDEALNSTWAKQVGQRANEIAGMLLTGEI